MSPIYGIDLSKDKFDVSFVCSEQVVKHKVYTNDLKGICKFLALVPPETVICAEHTGTYGDMLVLLALSSGIRISLIPGYEIKHSLGLQKGKSDPIDAARIREYGERFFDKLIFCEVECQELYELKELYRLRTQLVETRKRLITLQQTEAVKPVVSIFAHRTLSEEIISVQRKIEAINEEITTLINSNLSLKQNFDIVTSIKGIGTVTACDLMIRTDNFKQINSARKCASYAGIAPYPNKSGKMDRGNRTSHMGDKQLKSLLYMCALSAKNHNKEMNLYYRKKYEIEKKHFYVVLNNIANKLLRIIYALINKQVTFDVEHICNDPRRNIKAVGL